MGHPKKLKKQYKKPRRTWDKARMEKEAVIVKLYGLKNKRELRKSESILRNKRESARNLLSMEAEERAKKQKELIGSLVRIGVINNNATADDVLSLNVEAFLERRLQTIVWRKNLANTINQARQIIVHGHIAVAGNKLDVPGYLVRKDEETKLNYFGKKIILEPPKKEDPAKAVVVKEEAFQEKKEERVEKKAETPQLAAEKKTKTVKEKAGQKEEKAEVTEEKTVAKETKEEKKEEPEAKETKEEAVEKAKTEEKKEEAKTEE